MSSTERHTPASLLDRVSLILDCFSKPNVSLSVSEIARQTGLPKSTTSRLISSLVSHRFLEYSDGKLVLGLRFFELGENASVPQTLRRLTRAQMELLRHETGHTVQLAVLEGQHVVYLEILRARATPKLPSRVGGRVPAHATALGKAILAFSSPTLTETLVDGGLTKIGPRTITDPNQFRADLWTTRAEGVALDEEESTPNLYCVAVPILVGDKPVAAISVSAHGNDLDVKRTKETLLRVSRVISNQAKLLPSHRRTV